MSTVCIFVKVLNLDGWIYSWQQTVILRVHGYQKNGVVSSSSVSVKDSFPALNFPANVLLFSFDTMKVMKLYEEGNGEKR